MEKDSQPTNFIREIIKNDVQNDKHNGRVQTRFPPEPNGYLHIGHAKSICLNFGVAQDFNGRCHLRFDDTNPEKENEEFVHSIQDDIRWLGFEWHGDIHYASDYFEALYDMAVTLIEKGLAYVDDLSADDIREYRGTLTEPGRESPFRNRSVADNLELFAKMKEGQFEDGAKVLRAKIDMASPHIVMRDPTLYRIKRQHHYRLGDAWCIFPMYDFTHCLSDSLESITHSLCTLEFENNRRLYDWILDQLDVYHPQQIEFARLNLTHTVLSKRKLQHLVAENICEGWDDPRMPTLAGLRRRGYTPASIRNFCAQIGVARFNSTVDLVVLENSLREHLNRTAQRVMGVLEPIKVVITNYPEAGEEYLDAVNNPEDAQAGHRSVPFSRELYIERNDFMEDPPKKFFRLAPGREVRLRYAYYITCQEVIKDDNGDIQELRCTYDPLTKGGDSPDGRKVKATLHWVSARHAVNVEVRQLESLFTVTDPNDHAEGGSFLDFINPDSMKVLSSCWVEPFIKEAQPLDRFQFERLGYYCVDPKWSTADKLVLNRTVTLKDSWAKVQKESAKQSYKNSNNKRFSP